MKRLCRWLSVVSALGLASVSSLASDTYVSGLADFTLAMSKDGWQKSVLGLQPKLEYEGDQWFGVAEVRFWTEGSGELYPNGLERSNYTRGNRPLKLANRSYLETKDIWLARNFHLFNRRSEVKLGKQQVVWGALDQVRVLDLINPQHFREFVFPDLEHTRVGLWGVRLKIDSPLGLVDVFASSDRVVHEVAPRDGEFAFKASRFNYGLSSSPQNTSSVTVTRSRPSSNTIGIRLSGRSDSLDYSFVGYHGPDHVAVASLDFTQVGSSLRPSLKLKNDPRTVFGFSVSSGFGRVVARTEYAYHSRRSFNTLTRVANSPSLLIDEGKQHQLAFAIDYSLAGNTLLNFQWVYDRVAGVGSGLIRSAQERLLTLSLRKPFMNERLIHQLKLSAFKSGADRLFRYRIDYRRNANLTLSVGVDLAHGSVDDVFGQFESQSRIYVEAKQYW